MSVKNLNLPYLLTISFIMRGFMFHVILLGSFHQGSYTNGKTRNATGLLEYKKVFTWNRKVSRWEH
jgi:hypothetical protein